ncbi:MAG: thiamine-phosphate kinase [Rhodothermales bacterium]|nr:thiamine-phosphate kinase [Rhodothermales bacterium]
MDYTPISEVGEFGLIDRLHTVLGRPDDGDLLAGIADDAAVYRVAEGRVHVVTTDALIEAVHFDRAFMPMEYLGFKALSVNVSDVLAMNALPRYATIALGLPNNVSVEMVEALYRGFKNAAEAYQMTVVGGDTTAARFMTIVVTVIGEAAEADVVYRGGAQPGDALCVTGDLGAAYAGLKVMLDERKAMQRHRRDGEPFEPDLEGYQYVVQRQLAPLARFDAVRDWAARGVRPHALIDVSDGLASEVHHLAQQSGCGALLHGPALPIALETRRVADRFAEDVDTYALFGGEDYELLFALPEGELEKLDPDSFTVVGHMAQPGDDVEIQLPEGETIPLRAGGFQHFGGE